MANEIPILPYGKKDPQDVLAAIKAMLPGLTEGQWTDFLDSDVGYALIKTFVGILDRHLYWTDQQVSEAFLSFCRQRESAVRIAQQLNYPIASASSATVEAMLQFPAFAEQIEIPANSVWLINNIPFSCLSSIVIPPSQTSLQISLVQGTPYSLNKTATGAAWMQITLPRNISRLVVKVNNLAWAKIDSWIGVTDKKSFKFGEKIDGQSITFGANIGTDQPVLGDEIAITGLLTLGSKGNIALNNYPISPTTAILNSGNQDISNSFTGYTLTAAIGGTDVETIESIKAHAPAFYTTQGRCVTKADYEAVIARVPTVREVKVTPGQDIDRYGEVHITVYGDDPYVVPNDLKTLILDTIKPLMMIAITPVIKSPVVVEISQVINIGIDSSVITDLSSGRNAVDNVVFDLFNSLKVEESLYESAELKAIQSIPGMVFVNYQSVVTSFANSLAGKIEIPVIKNGDFSSVILKKANGDIIFSGTGTLQVTDGVFKYTVSGLADQKCKLIYKASSDDILLNEEQVIVLTSLAINAEYSS